MKKTKIICTLGPSTDNELVLTEMIKSGMDCARFNFSHGSYEETSNRLALLRRVEEKTGKSIACILDTKGPEIRLGKVDGKINLIEGDMITLTTEEILGTKDKVTVSHKNLPNDVSEGTIILIDDGLVALEVKEINWPEIVCQIKNSGEISSNKGVNLPGTKTSLPSLTEKDVNDLKFGADNGFDYVAASFIRTKEDILIIKKYLETFGKPKMKVIAKIENQEGLDNFDEILSVSDGIMVARGDLGVEVPVEKLPSIQKHMIKSTVNAGKIVITATQMLDSMMHNPRPTRAEVTDVANAILDGTSAIMLSGETAGGLYPLESVKMMARIAEETEQSPDYLVTTYKRRITDNPDLSDKNTYRECINFSAYTTATVLKAKALCCVSEEGKSPRVLSKFRPNCPIIVVTRREQVARELSLEWGIVTTLIKDENDFDVLFDRGIDQFKMQGLIEKGDIVVISGGATHSDSQQKQIIGGIFKV